MENFINPNLDGLTPFIVMEVLERANAMQRNGIDIVHLEVGEPDFDPPESITRAACAALTSGKTHYTHSLGSAELREEIARFYTREYSVTVDPGCVVVTSGSSPAILIALMTLCPSGDEVIISNPGYACYRNFILSIGAVPVEIPVHAENNFEYDHEDLKTAITPKTRAIFLNSPMNPTGTLARDEALRLLADTSVTIISDEIYHGLVYEGRTRSMLEFTDNAFVVSGFSKRFAMTGFRLGYVIAPKHCIRTLQILQQNLFICAPSMAQSAGIAALRDSHDDVKNMCSLYDERRRYMIERLTRIGFRIAAQPKGAFYIFCNARRFTDNSYTFAFDVLEHAHVGITPGIDFGSRGEGFVRFSYANSIERIREGMDRLERYCKGLHK